MTTPYIELPCSNCDGTGGFQSNNGPSPRISRCERCRGRRVEEFPLATYADVLDAIDRGATYQSLLDAFRAAGFTEAEAERMLDDELYTETLTAVERPANAEKTT